MRLNVQCPKCGTDYQVDDSKIPENGVRARCPKCEHRFLLTKQKENLDLLQEAEEVRAPPKKGMLTTQTRIPKWAVVPLFVVLGLGFLFANTIGEWIAGESGKPQPARVEAIPRISQDRIQEAIQQIEAYPMVRDAHVQQKGDQLTLAIVVDYATSKASAQQLGDNFVRLVKSLSDDTPPGKHIGQGIYNYLVGVFYPNQKTLAMGAKDKHAVRISW